MTTRATATQAKSRKTQITLETRGGAAWLTLDGPSTRNALDAASAAAIVAACDEIDANDAIGVAVISGGHGAFCSGAARSTLAGLSEVPAHVAYEELGCLYRAFDRVGRLTLPTIARIDGAAVGAGLNLALAADLRVATERSQFISGFAGVGIHPGGGHFHLIDRAAGRQTAAAMGLFAQPLDAVDAAAAGLIWAALPVDEIDDVVAGMCATLAADPALARAMKSTLNLTTASQDSWAAAVEVERARQMWSLTRNPRSK